MGALVEEGNLTEAQVEELLKNVRKKGKNTNTARNSRSRKEAEVGKQDNLVIRESVIEIDDGNNKDNDNDKDKDDDKECTNQKTILGLSLNGLTVKKGHFCDFPKFC